MNRLFALLLAIAALPGTAALAEDSGAPVTEPATGGALCQSYLAQSTYRLDGANLKLAARHGELCGKELLPTQTVDVEGIDINLPQVKLADGTLCQAYVTDLSSVGEVITVKVGNSCEQASL